MLRRPPKLSPELRTKSAFRVFFTGMDRKRMKLLLEAAYADETSGEWRDKVDKRLTLLEDVLV